MRNPISAVVLALALASTPLLAASNSSLKIRQEALSKLVKAIGARGETDKMTWTLSQPQVEILTNGIKLKGTIVARQKPVRRPVSVQPQPGGPTLPGHGTHPALLPNILSPFSISMDLQQQNQQLRLKASNQKIGIMTSQGLKLGTVDLSPIFDVRFPIQVPKIKVGNSTHSFDVEQLEIQTAPGYLTVSARIDA